MNTRFLSRVAAVFVSSIVATARLQAADSFAVAVPETEQPEASFQRPQGQPSADGAYKTRISPHWFADNLHFWYRNDLSGGRREYILVDAAHGERQPAFDHARLAAALAEALKVEVSAERLPLENLEFAPERQSILFRTGGKDWRCSLHTYGLTEIADRPPTEDARNSAPERADRRRRSGFRSRADATSPDGKWTAFVRDFNIFLRSTEDGKEIQLSQDGKDGGAYDMLQWAPDSQTLVAFRVEPGERKEVYLVESSPREGGRAKLQSRAYDLPGDKFASYELHLFNVADEKEIACDVEPIDFGRPRLRWRKNGLAFTYEKTDRGHQRFRVIEVDARSGESRRLIDERTETFIWTAHTENVDLDAVNWLQNSEEIVYASERDGWRHLYLVDAEQGTIKHQITQGDFVVRGIDRIDEERRQVWFRASGKNTDQDPYLIHYYRVDFDGSHLVALTDGDGNHSVQFSPDRSYLIDTYSRVDRAPVHELRRAADGKLICQLETADVTELQATGWKPPEVFHAKGRDGQTDIWGIICRPRDFDPAKKYPIIEDIYAGPQSSFVPKTFSGRDRYRSLNDLGFVVLKIDGMGTANRSKAFHDVCWHNLKDAGFLDRILWIKAAAAKYPYLDLERVGVYGTSAGGQNAAGAVLFHPEFYKAAVANCGCHDNRMDKASWNEQWMGYPVGPWYSESSNIDNASRLQANLLLIVGELDTNVPPESTYRLVDALIKAGKDFDFFIVPGGGHGAGGAYAQRRREDFFVRHLLGRQPPNRNMASVTDVATTSAAAGAAALDLASLARPASRIAAVAARYRADRSNLGRFYVTRESPATRERMKKFYLDWLDGLAELRTASLTEDDRRELDTLHSDVLSSFAQLELEARKQTESGPLVPFASTIMQLVDDRRQLKRIDAQSAAKTVDELGGQVERILAAVIHQLESKASGELDLTADTLGRAASMVGALRNHLQRWHAFYNGYDPAFTWWLRAPFQKADSELEKYATFLRDQGKAAGPRAEGASSGEATEAAGNHSSSPRNRGDAPDLRELMTDSSGDMQFVIEKFQSETSSGRGRRGGESGRPNSSVQAREEVGDARPGQGDSQRGPDSAADTREQRMQSYKKWLAAVEKLDFDNFSHADRVDYLLLKNDIDYRLRRLDYAGEPGRRERGIPVDASGIAGRPIGRDALLLELAHEMISYTPEELVEIAEREYAWCEAELKRASREMGLGDDTRQAVEKVKSLHVPPGEQPYLIRDLAWEAIDYLRKHDLVTVPPLAAETWGMQMMSPQRQLINPFFTGGPSISVSFPTDEMSHEAKLQSMRGNNIPFARATVHHELIPGHNLQSYMSARYRPYRRPFSTPFWGEGWALYWEMLLYGRGFAQTPEDRVGFLVWRTHRCARIVFSLNFHLGRMTPQECIDYLVAKVGFDPHNAAAEVRRSFETSYSPLYQAAYMTGGLQFRALHRELVESGKMTDRQFHDAILKENSMPVEMVRAVLINQPLTRVYQARWRFYDVGAGVAAAPSAPE